ncbi:hypothetical protein DKP78_20215, partial [Enterococcus faecium]
VYLRPNAPERITYAEARWDDWVRLFFELLTILSCVIFMFYLQAGELSTQGIYGYIRNLRTAPSKIVFVIANICILACVPFRLMGNVYV